MLVAGNIQTSDGWSKGMYDLRTLTLEYENGNHYDNNILVSKATPLISVNLRKDFHE